MTLAILVIDDDEVDRAAIRRAVEKSDLDGFVSEAPDALTGIRLLEKYDFDCVLLDYRLPDLDGTDVLSRIVTKNSKPLAIIIMTGQGNETVAQDALKRGAAQYLTKSEISPDALSTAITDAIQKLSDG